MGKYITQYNEYTDGKSKMPRERTAGRPIKMHRVWWWELLSVGDI